MNYKTLIVTTIALFVAYLLGWYSHHPKEDVQIKTQTDTTFVTVHDTLFTLLERNLVRTDTCYLARVDTICTMDSVFVSVPISEQTWVGDNYNIKTEGFHVQLLDVQMAIPIIEKTVVKERVKHWNWGVGVQAGYGATIHGLSPYVGVGVSAGYNF